MDKINLLMNRVLHLFELRRVYTRKKEIYLSFDDGPEGEITEFVLKQLNKYNAKATFFCKGQNAIQNREQLQKIINEGHAIGNHTFSHINSFNTPVQQYVYDVNKADEILHSHLFRPPWGSITLIAFLKLRYKYRIVYWSLLSGDTFGEKLCLEDNMQRLYSKTKPGDIVLFHSCNLHEKETKLILPLYLSWLSQNGFKCEVLK